MAMENLAIIQHCATFWYATIHGGGYQPHVHRFELGHLCTCSRLHRLPWMLLENVSFRGSRRYYLLECCCWRVKMVRHGRTMCVTMQHVIFLMWMVKLTLLWQLILLDFIICCVGKPRGLPLCWFVIGVPRGSTWDALGHLCKKYWLTNGFAHNAFNWLRYLFLWLDSNGSF
jgi:hypothetical protein